MQRRKFMRLAGMGLTAGALTNSAYQFETAVAEQQPPRKQTTKPRRALMTVGTQNVSSNELLGLLSAFGVNHICSALPSTRLDEQWSVEGLTRLKERVESFGIKLDMVPLPLSSNYIFKETFIDDGDVDMLKAMRVYKEVGYDGMMMPDHVPKISADAQGYHAFAYTFGYIKALIAAVEAEA